jgi:hypothetical protein
MITTVAASAIALPILFAVAPAASAATTVAQPTAASTSAATPIGGGGSVALCFPLGSVVFCI